MKFKILAAAIVLILFQSCKAPKDIAYFEDTELIKSEIISKSNNYEPKLKSGDKLIITVSAIDPVAVAPFNLPINSLTDILQNSGSSSVTDRKNLATTQSYIPYIVDSEGFINFPVLGKIQVKDLTPTQLTSVLEKEISESVDNPIINVRLDNFKVSVLGEVLRPGSFNVYSDRISLFDALGMAGDLTIYGNRKNVCVVRDINGEKTLARVDLTKSDILDSPYFYLQQNDVLYIEPNNKKKKTARYSQAEQYNLSVISTLASTLSVITSVVVSVIAIKNK